MTTNDIAELRCSSCDVDFTGTVFVNIGETHFYMNEPETFEVRGEMPMFEPDFDDLFWPTPDDPHGIAAEALGHLYSMVEEIENPVRGDPQFGNRLVFSGAIAVLEAFLGDTIRNKVRTDQKALVRFATKNRIMRRQAITVGMSDLETTPDILTQTVEGLLNDAVDRHLSEILYHNLDKVTAIYESALGYDPLPFNSDRKTLFKYMQLRHDCVHRNGVDSEGRKHTLFTTAYVREALDAVERTIEHIDKHVALGAPF